MMQMPNPEELIASVVASAGGEIVGRVRLQKVIYLLDQLGLNSGFSYSYHHYGPYSADLVDAVDGAKAFRFIDEQTRHRRSDGVPFSVFLRGPNAGQLKADRSDLAKPDFARALGKMEAQSATVLELAATIHWLRTKESVPDWTSELVRRKGVKTEGGRMEEAVELLRQLGLQSDR
jgi:uncharacterized protein YwgA